MKSLQLLHQHHDLELDLGLSIGGSFRNLPEKSTGLGSLLVSDGDDSGVTDEKNRCEIRRREVKRKRDEKKRQNRGGRSFVSVQDDDDDDERNQPLKREKKLEECDLMNNNVDLNKPPDSAVVQMPYSYPSLQYVPFLNGYAFPCVMPYWASGAAAAAVDGGGDERTLHQPVACRSFKPFEANRSVSDVGFSNLKTGSCGSSPVCSSSVISDNYPSSSSHEGGGSSYTRSNSCNSSSDRRQIPNPNPKSNDSVNNHPCSDNRAQCEEKFVKPHVCKTTTTIKKEPIIASNKDEVVVPMPTTSKSVLNPPLKSSMTNMKMENGKPPKPQNQSHNVPNLQQMPCVSTTGVGPNGKTITGFLYRYSNSEVSILCVCHGESFSPAEFVKHAGGGEVSHPLRHITVLPSTIR